MRRSRSGRELSGEGDPISLHTTPGRALLDASDKTGGVLDARHMLPAIARASRDATHADYGAVTIASPGGGIGLFVPSGNIGRAHDGPWIAALADIMSDAGLRDDVASGPTARAPIVGEKGLVGWIHVARAAPFGDRELRALDDIARFAAGAYGSRVGSSGAASNIATMLSALSHEVRTPLTVILGSARTLERHHNGLDDETRIGLLGRVTASALRLERIFTDLMESGSPQRDPASLHLRSTDLAGLVRMVVAESDEWGARPLSLDTGEPVMLDVDAVKIERILEHLLANVRAHVPANAPVWIRMDDRGGEVVLVVEDAGPGVPVEDREAIFEPLRVGARAQAHAPGTGLGLAVVARYAELHGGRAWVEERAGGGASFRVALPRSAAPVTQS